MKALPVLLLLLALSHGVLATSPPALEFVPNHGQWPTPVQLRAEVGPGLTVFLENRQLTFLRYDAPAWAAAAHRASRHPDSAFAPVQAHAWAVGLLGARAATRPVAEGVATGSVRNYFLGRDPQHWAPNVRATTAARYADAWPGISLVVHSSPEGAFEYDLEVKPGANPARVRLRYHGLEKLTLDPVSGHLQLLTALGELQEAAPVAWQLDDAGRRVAVPCRFVLKSASGAAGDVSFALPAGYDRRRPLVIDPVLIAATYSGSIAPTFGHTATYDATGHLYAAGPCYEPGYPTTLGAYNLTHSFNSFPGSYLNPDVAVSRYSADGRRLLYATYLGGQEPDYPHSLLVNHRGELLILGSTLSADFPTTAGAYDRSLGSSQRSDAFVAKLDSTGSRLVGSTFIGGFADDGISPEALRFFYGDEYRGDLAVDSLDRVFVATSTQSLDFPFTPGAVRPPVNQFASSAVVLRLSSELTTLDWAAGLGTAAAAYGLYLPASGAPYVVGATVSVDLPTTPGTLEPAAAGSLQHDGFVAQLAADGSAVRAATYLRPGTTGRPASQTFFIQPDPQSSDGYVLGSSTGFYPATAGTWGQSGGGLVIQRLSADLIQRSWTTTIGHPVTNGDGQIFGDPRPDTDNLSPTAFLVDECKNIYISGWGRTQGLPTTPDAVQRVTRASGIGGDLYLLVLDPDATGLRYASFLGGTSVNNFYEEHVDGGTSRFDPQGRVYQAVCTNSHNFPTRPDAWRRNNSVANEAYDEVAFKLDFEPRICRAAGSSTTLNGQPTNTFEAPATVQFTNASSQYPGTTWQWSFGDGSSNSPAFEPTHLYLNPGTFTVRLITSDPDACVIADTAYLQVIITGNDSTDLIAYTICRGDSVQFAPIAATVGSFNWTPAVTLSSATALAPIASPRVSTVYAATGQLAGTTRRNTWQVTVTVLQPDTVLLTADPHCLPGGSDVSLLLNQPLRAATWDFGDGSVPQTLALTQEITHFYSTPGAHTVKVRGRDSQGCPTSGELTIVTDKLFVPNVITPNADGLNDTFVVDCLKPGTATLRIYNRWGRQVYDSGNGQYLNQWGGADLTSGMYYYYFQFNYLPTAFKGWVEVVR